jgi:CheY-like chemotaxis protein
MSFPHSGRIVVIDDNVDLADMFGSLCDILGYQVEVCYSGSTGLDVIQKFLPQVIFCDINMPGMSGLEVAKRLRKLREIPYPLLVAVTAESGSNLIDNILSAGFDLYLGKPTDIQIVTALLRDYFESLA